MRSTLFKSSWDHLRDTAKAWNDDNATLHAAALAYYTAFSIAPLIVIAIAVTGVVLGKNASRGDIFATLSSFLGANAAQGVQVMVQDAAAKPSLGWMSGIAGVLTLIVGSSGTFQQLQQSLNLIWGVQSGPGRGIWTTVRQRFLSFSMVGLVAFLLLVSLLASAATAALGQHLSHGLPGGEAFWHLVNFAISFGVITLLFALVYKILPDVRISWRNVWTGSAVTAFLFVVGKFLIGLYLGKTSVASSYGAAGSLIVLLLWVYYSSLILFFGAEFTKVHVLRQGRHIDLKRGAQWIRVDYQPKQAEAG
jgi:membrane protein